MSNFFQAFFTIFKSALNHQEIKQVLLEQDSEEEEEESSPNNFSKLDKMISFDQAVIGVSHLLGDKALATAFMQRV